MKKHLHLNEWPSMSLCNHAELERTMDQLKLTDSVGKVGLSSEWSGTPCTSPATKRSCCRSKVCVFYVSVCGCVWVCVCLCEWVCVGACECVCACECECVCVSVCECVWVCVRLCECVWVRVSVCGCVWVCVFSPWSVKITSLIGRPLFQVRMSLPGK